MNMGRSWAWLGVWSAALCAAVSLAGAASAQTARYVFHRSATNPIIDTNQIAAWDFARVVREQTAVAELAVSLINYTTSGFEDTGRVKFVLQDAKNRLIFSTLINVEFSGDTVAVPLIVDTAGSAPPFFFAYKPTTAPFTVSFRPNVRGLFRDTLTFQFVTPVARTLKLALRGQGTGPLRLLNIAGQAVDSFAITYEPTRVGDSLRIPYRAPSGANISIRVANVSSNLLGKISDVISSRPASMHPVGAQIEVQPGDTQLVQMTFTPRVLDTVSAVARIISDDFAVDTPKVLLSGRGRLSLDYFTDDDTTDILGNTIHLVIDSLRMLTTNAGATRDTLIWLQNKLNQNVEVELLMNRGRRFKLLRQIGAQRNERDTLFFLTGTTCTPPGPNDSVKFRNAFYRPGEVVVVGADTVRFGADTVLVDCVLPRDGVPESPIAATIVPVVLERTLPLNDSMRVWVRFKPDLRATYTDSIRTIYKPFIGSEETVTGYLRVSARAIGPGFVASRDSIDFGPLTPGLTVKDSVLATNPGSLPVTLTVDTTGLDPVFRLRSENIITFPAGSSTYVVFEYTAVDALLHLDTVFINSNDPNNPSVRLILSGGTQAPLLSPSSTLLNFGDVVVSDSLTRVLTVSNRGLVTLNVTGITRSRPEYTVTPTAFVLAPGAAQAVNVKFVPSAPLAFPDTLLIASNDPKRPTTRVALAGGGANPTYSGDTLLSFGATTLNAGSLVDSVAIRNNGTRGNMIVRPRVLQGAYFDLPRRSDSLVFVGAGKTARIPVRFSQSDTARVWDSLVLTTNDPATPTVHIALTGGGFFKQLRWLSGPLKDTTAYQFGKVSTALPETLTSVLTNVGNDTLHVSSVALAAGDQGFKRVTPSLASLLQNERFNVTVAFTAPAGGVFFDTLIIRTDDTTAGNDSIVVPLEATGFVPGLKLLAPALNFDTTVVGQVRLDSAGLNNPADFTTNLTSVTLRQGTRFTLAGAPTSIAGGATRYIRVNFNPLDTIGYVDTVVVITTNPSETIRIPLTGAGAGAKYGDDVDSLSFPPVAAFGTSQRQFRMFNRGNRPLDIISIAPKSASGIFRRLSPASLVLGSGEEATVTVGFTPLASNAYLDTLIVTTNDASSPIVKIPMFGQTPDQDIDFSPGRLTQVANPSLDIGGVRVGSFREGAVVVYNVGLAPLQVFTGALERSGTGFTFAGGQLNNKTILPGDSIRAQVRYTATQKISETNRLIIWSNDPDEDTVRVNLSASGISGQLRITSVDSAFRFGVIKVGRKDTSKVVSIQNTLGQRFRLTFANFLTLPQPDYSIIAGLAPVGGTPTYLLFSPDSLPTLGRDSIIFLRLIYAPADTGSDNTTFRVIGTPDNAGDTINIPVSGRGGAPVISLSPTSFDYGTLIIGPASSRTATLSVRNSGPDTLFVTSLAPVNPGAATYTAEPPLPWKIAPNQTGTGFTIRVRTTARKVYYDTLALGNNDSRRDPTFFYTRVVGVAPGDVGFVDTVRISDFEYDAGRVIVPVYLAFDEAIKRVSIPLKYSSSIYECVGLEFNATLLENKDGLVPSIDTVNNIVIIKANTIFSSPIRPDPFVGKVLARMIFRAKAGVGTTDSAITFDTTFVPPDVSFMLQDTALKLILPEFVAGQLDIRTGIDDGLLPESFALEQNFPNPFNPQTTIAFWVPRVAHVRLVVFNLLGQRIIALVDEVVLPGRREVEWNGRDQTGREVSSGIYFYHLSAEDFTETRKMVFMK